MALCAESTLALARLQLGLKPMLARGELALRAPDGSEDIGVEEGILWHGEGRNKELKWKGMRSLKSSSHRRVGKIASVF